MSRDLQAVRRLAMWCLGEACAGQKEEQVQSQSLVWLEQAVRKGEEWALRLDQQ